MAKLTIKDWNLGIGESPYVGFAQMVNVDIYSKPGALKISNKLAADANSADIVTELLVWIVQDPTQGDVYAVDREGKLYKRDEGTATWSVITGHGSTGAAGQGLGIWKDYLFYARAQAIDVYGPLSGSPSWTNDWRTSLNSASHPMLSSSQRFVLYIGNGSFVDSLEQNAGMTFAPGSAGTYTYNDEDLELGSDYEVTSLEEVGTDVAIGTKVGLNGIINIADIFFWDGASDFISGGKTVRLVENGVQMMINANNTLFTIAGTGVPRLFNSVTSQSTELKRFNNIDLPFDRNLSLYPDATELKEGEVLFGIGRTGGIGDVSPMGIYSYRNQAYTLRYVISTLRIGQENNIVIGSVKSVTPNAILVSWQDSENLPEFGVDILTENLYTDYTAFVESALYTVGTEDDPTTFEKIQITLGKPLFPGDSIRLSARYSLDEAYTVIAEFDSSIYAGRNTMDQKVSSVGKFKEIQILVELNTAVDSLAGPEVKQIDFT